MLFYKQTNFRCPSVLSAVPCVPTNVSVVMDCDNNTALVSWSASRGALQYSVTARGSHSNVSCQTSDLSCSLGNLTCGSSYTVQVAAMDGSCSSVPSQAVVLNSGETNNNNNNNKHTHAQLQIFFFCRLICLSSYSQPPAHPRTWVPTSTVLPTTWPFPGTPPGKRTTSWCQWWPEESVSHVTPQTQRAPSATWPAGKPSPFMSPLSEATAAASRARPTRSSQVWGL